MARAELKIQLPRKYQTSILPSSLSPGDTFMEVIVMSLNMLLSAAYLWENLSKSIEHSTLPSIWAIPGVKQDLTSRALLRKL